MSEHLHQENYDIDEEDYDDDLEGFVVDEVEDICDDYYDDYGDGEDYSSAIREIFGYNKNRYNAII